MDARGTTAEHHLSQPVRNQGQSGHARLVPAVVITTANVQDTTGGKLLLSDVATNHPSMSKVWADGG